MNTAINPFDHQYFLGYVSQVLPQFVKIHFPSSVLLNGFTHLGVEYNGGLVGSFIVIEGDRTGFLGRLTELSLPESERLSLNEKAFQTSDFHPTGKVEILLSFDLYAPEKVKKGISSFPSIGAKVFVSSGAFVQTYLSNFGVKENASNVPVVPIGHLTSNPSTTISLSIQSVLGRHCAIVGTTGGGKSYTVSKIVEAIISTGNKAVLIDATGEYNGAYQNTKTIKFGEGNGLFHYSQLTIDDIFFLLKPSPKTQAPKLLEAIRTLKMIALNNHQSFYENGQEVGVQEGLVRKANAFKRPLQAFQYRNIAHIENGLADFDITKLASQITNECVWDTARDDDKKYGGVADIDISYCISLISRVNNLTRSSEFVSLFGFNHAKKVSDVTNEIEMFLSDPNYSVLRLDCQDVKFDFQIREILVNAIGRYFLHRARKKEFKLAPLVLILDEAHQFLNKTIKDDNFESRPLEAFDSIAKECRKLGLFLCIATQMPRDIPNGTLSQMGTFIVHRLINQYDKEAISNACSSANRSTLDFLPILGEGEAVLTGVDFPMPIVMKFDEPVNKPDSKTPNLFNRKPRSPELLVQAKELLMTSSEIVGDNVNPTTLIDLGNKGMSTEKPITDSI